MSVFSPVSTLRISSPTLLLMAGLCCFTSPGLQAEEPAASADAPTVFDAIRDGTWSLSTRVRHEFVDQDGMDHRANAFTARLAMSYQTGVWNDLSAGVGVQATQRLWRQRYAAGPTAPQPGYPVVVDPDGGNINLAWLRWTPHDDLTLTAGRQRIIHDNARFIGNVGWRQTEQTFDALRIEWDAPAGIQAEVGYIATINTIFGTEQYLHGVFARAESEIEGIGTLVGFAHYFDYQDADALDLLTLGVRFTGSQDFGDDLRVQYSLSGAWQSDVADNPNDVSEYYLAAEVAVVYSGIRAHLGWERLSGDGDVAFETPLATKHAFNGWSDKFLNTPAAGLDDFYVGIGGPVPGVDNLTALARVHWFRGVDSSDDYGQEYNAQVIYNARQWDPSLQFGAKVAYYDADEAFTDTLKTWLWMGYGF